MENRSIKASYFRNFVFGVEDSLVSTVGLLSGISIAGMDKGSIIVTGTVLIFVEAISMSAGTFLSESSAEEYEAQKESSSRKSMLSSAVMFLSYFLSGFIPLAPYVFLEGTFAFWGSLGVSLLALVVLGIVGATISHVSVFRNSIRMVLIGGLAIAVGAIVGRLVG